MTQQEKMTDRTVLQFKICMLCGHLQSTGISGCERCNAGAIGLGKPRELWAYLDLKIEGILKLPSKSNMDYKIPDLTREILTKQLEGIQRES